MASRQIVIGLLGMFACFVSSPARGHMSLSLPNGGEVLQVGSVYAITWVVDIPHDLQNWDLWYSTDRGASYIPIEMDLPPGDGTQGAIHTYDWTIPNTPSTQVRVRVRMDNTGFEYLGESGADLAIEAAASTTHVVHQVGFTFVPAEITVEPGDTVRWDWSEGLHTVTSGVPCIPDGVFFDSPLDAGATTFGYVIPADGTTFIPYFCIPHCGIGMTGTITIDVPSATGACCDGATQICSEDTTQVACEGAGARYGGDGSTCATIDPPCLVLTGACYDDTTGACEESITRVVCDGQGFRYDGDDSSCAVSDPVPAVSEWELVILTLLLLVGAKVCARRWRTVVTG